MYFIRSMRQMKFKYFFHYNKTTTVLSIAQNTINRINICPLMSLGLWISGNVSAMQRFLYLPGWIDCSPEDCQDWSKHVGGGDISTVLLLFNTATVPRSSGLNEEGVVRITQESGAPRENSVVWVTKKSLDAKVQTLNPLALELDIYSLAHHLCKM